MMKSLVMLFTVAMIGISFCCWPKPFNAFMDYHLEQKGAFRRLLQQSACLSEVVNFFAPKYEERP